VNTPRYAAAAAKLISKNLPSAAVVAGDEARGVATIERAMRARVRRRRAIGVGSVLSVAASVLLVATQLPTWHGSSAEASAAVSIDVTPSGNGAALARTAGDEPLKTRVSIESGQRIDTPADGGASLQLSTGTSMTLAGRTSFRVDSQGSTQRFSLQHGELVAQVAKLSATQRFVVTTPDAEVEVRGTRFRLRVVDHAETCGAGTRTRLEVTEGAVEVRVPGLGVTSVKAGQLWPTDCSGEPPMQLPTPAAPVARPAAAATPSTHAHRTGAVVSSGAPTAVIDAERASALAPQNDLFAEGVARGRQGDTGGALRAYQELISRFPSSALAENAMVERMRLLGASADGSAEAKRYLARYPRGFAVAEAKKLVVEP
jgi:ferric-dicitrate binding protein FerR (iron transport regulator)